MQGKLKSNYEVIKLVVQIGINVIILTPQINITDARYKQSRNFPMWCLI